MTEFFLQEFSESRELQILHFAIFLTGYLAALMGNLLVITAISLDHHLHAPMFFFLMNLSILDLRSISVTVPKSMVNSLLNTRLISNSGCVAQVFLFVFFATANFTCLTVMAYDRPVAICKPLNYKTTMSMRACFQMETIGWIFAILYSALHIGNTFRLLFCQSNIINKFFCDVPSQLKLSSSDSHISEV
ncbi:olfactory receptor 14C36-like [Alligator sinensis]|uniref:Olfactory receptor 14C36-like n=1 Tax=Alligator sinensis TaxID=38654 RepID=A0A1U7S9H7_ALLSI|nr:olfactory receptor 14C36-like [Alligator sinensis]